MIVLDASAGLAALYNDGPARQIVATESVHALHLIDSEVAHGLRRAAALRQITAKAAQNTLATWQNLGLTRYAVHPHLQRVWQLRDNLSAYDAGYVALAEALGCGLVTADARLTSAPSIRCQVTVVPQ